MHQATRRSVPYIKAIILSIGAILLSYIASTAQASASTSSGSNPLGSIDYCSQQNGMTILGGWAHDADAAPGELPMVNVRVAGQPDQLVPSDIANYRDSDINSQIKSLGMPPSSVFGWKASFTGVYKGDAPAVSGTVANVGGGIDTAMTINTKKNVIGGDSTKSLISNGKLPDSCLPVRPATPVPHAPLPEGPFATPTPTVIIDPASDSNYTPWLRQYGVPIVEAWYPMVADKLAHPAYTPPSTMTIRVASFNGVAYAQGNSITISSSWLAGNMSTSQGVLIHEMVHVLQSYPDYNPSWITEGIADYVRYHMFRDAGDPQPPSPSSHYTDGYGTAGYFLAYIESKHPEFVRNLNISRHQNANADNFVLSYTGKTFPQLWNDMKAETGGSTGGNQVVNGSGKCLDVSSSNFTPGAKVQLWNCNGTSAQSWNWVTDTETGQQSLRTDNGLCLTVSGNGQTLGATVVLGTCASGSGAQQWEHRADNTLYNPGANACLSTQNSKTRDGTAVVIATCNASSSIQRWTFN